VNKNGIERKKIETNFEVRGNIILKLALLYFVTHTDAKYNLRNVGIKRWRMKTLDRVEWASIIKEGKAKLKGP
jgi:hypothetical protein